jgi:hypothetical protein
MLLLVPNVEVLSLLCDILRYVSVGPKRWGSELVLGYIAICRCWSQTLRFWASSGIYCDTSLLVPDVEVLSLLCDILRYVAVGPKRWGSELVLGYIAICCCWSQTLRLLACSGIYCNMSLLVPNVEVLSLLWDILRYVAVGPKRWGS